MNEFEPIKPTKAYEAAAEQIEKAILSGRFKVGSKLPPEREIIGLLNISRRTLREALRVLEQKGLIQIKLGSKGGAFIVDKVYKKVAESIDLMLSQKKISLKDITEFRSNAEGHIAQLVCKNASKKDIGQLNTLYSKSKELLEQDPLDYKTILKQEELLHLELARISGNDLYTVILKIVHNTLVFPSYDKSPVDDSYVRRAFDDWEKILAAVGERQDETARQLLIEHVEHFTELDFKRPL